MTPLPSHALLGRILAAAVVGGAVLQGVAVYGLYLLVCVLFGLMASAARAEPCAWAVLTVASKHVNGTPGKNYNEENWGLGSEHCLGKVAGFELRGAAGFFRNSNRIDSFYWGGSATLLEVGMVKAGVAVARVSGYELDPLTAVFPVLAIEGGRVGANVSYFPKTRSTTSAVGMQIKWRWR